MADPEKLLNSTKKTIRSLLISCKDGLSLYHLEKDHKELLGCTIPYQKLGFNSCQAMLASLQDVCRKTYDKTGAEVYKAVADESTAHIADMVSRQRSKKSKRAAKAKPNKFITLSRRPKSNYSFQTSSKYNPSFSSYASKYSGGSQAQQHPVHRATKWSSGESQNTRTYYDERRCTHLKSRSTVVQHASLSITLKKRENDPNREQTEEEVRANIKQVLEAYPGGVWLHLLSDMYRGQCGLNLPPAYQTAILHWTDVIDVQKMHGKEILYMATDTSKKSIQPITTGISLFAGEIKPPAIFQPGEKCEVFVSHVVPETGRLYVHRADSSLDSFMDELKKYYNSLLNLKTYTSIPAQCVCAAKDSNFNAWSRAFVSQVDHTKAKLFYLDFGNSELRSLNEIQPLAQQFTGFPAQAIAVQLFGIVTNSPSALARELRDLTEEVQLELTCQSIEGGISFVILRNTSEPTTSINSKLVSLGLAHWEDGVAPIGQDYSTNKIQTTTIISPIRAPAPITADVGATPSQLSPSRPSQAALPNSEYWTVIITYILTPSLLYVRIKDTSSDDFAKFQEEGPEVYSSQKPVSLLVIGHLYIARVVFDEDDEPGYYRVRATELFDSKTVDCEFVDYGFQHCVCREHLYSIIREQHIQIPYQTRLCALYGMDQVKEDNDRLLSRLEELTEDKTLIAQLVTVEQGIPHLVLFDTSGDDDIEINRELGNMLEDEGLTASLPTVGQTMDVALSYIEKNGTIFVQPIGPANLLLQNLMKSINDYYTKQNTAPEDFINKPYEGQVLCAKYEGAWYRATIRKLLPDKMVSVFFGDYGNSSTIPYKQLRRLPIHIEHVSTLPLQGLACKLSGLDGWNDYVGAEAANLMQSSDSFILMTVKASTDMELSQVQLSQGEIHLNNHLLKIYEDSRNAIVSTPATPIHQHHVSSTTSSPSIDTEEAISPPTPLDSPAEECEKFSMPTLFNLNAGDSFACRLEKLTLDQERAEDYVPSFVSPPDEGEFWDVFVTTTNEPDLFIVVPLSEITLLNELHERLHKDLENSPAVDFEPNAGELCAGKSADDGFWYRVLIVDGKIGNRYKVIFADYGHYDFMTLDRLRPLHKNYTKLNLQAVRAGLFDVLPAVGNCWTASAKTDFASLCNDKRLVSKIHHVDRSKTLLHDGPSVLFELFDTSGNLDINIDEELVKRGHAKFKDSC
ncbi:tudor domain-containing protein 7B-like [Watersipora subatra]|uniref:tudor domain-containing protein 7B-like n=1 Tax=Watersipora subatra TaxID=2589382 RepID=UPI00355BE8CB